MIAKYSFLDAPFATLELLKFFHVLYPHARAIILILDGDPDHVAHASMKKWVFGFKKKISDCSTSNKMT